MRIFFVAQKTPNEIDLPGSGLWHANLYQPLVELGHEVIRFEHDWLATGYALDLKQPAQAARAAAGRPAFGAALLAAVRAEHARRPLDLFFSYFSAAHVEAEIIRAIGRLGITTVNWYCNASYQFHLVEPIAAAFDFCLVPEKFRLEDYRRAGARPIYCQEAANPRVYQPRPVAEEYDVSFVGACYGTRPAFIDALLRGGVDARVWGPGWLQYAQAGPRMRETVRRLWHRLQGRLPPPRVSIPAERCGGPLSDEELVTMYSRSRISLGFSAVLEMPAAGQPPIKQVRLRDFEATMSGACYLVEYVEELTEFFEPDKEILCFHDAAELIDKARFYLRHEGERRRIRAAALRRARAEHTWQARFRQAFRTMGLV